MKNKYMFLYNTFFYIIIPAIIIVYINEIYEIYEIIWSFLMNRVFLWIILHYYVNTELLLGFLTKFIGFYFGVDITKEWVENMRNIKLLDNITVRRKLMEQ